mgnify:CR=1 FL=1
MLFSLQVSSYEAFLQRDIDPVKRKNVGLQATFKNLFPIESFSKNARLEFVSYRLEDPEFNQRECQLRGLSYSAPLRVKTKLITYDKTSDKETVKEILDDLKKRGFLLYVEDYPHIYPHCWRSGDELVFRSVDEWYINMDWRKKIKKIVDEINWIPEWGQEREHEWLDNMGDWMISKKRFWGLALPIWIFEDESYYVVGSKEELKELAVEGWDEFEDNNYSESMKSFIKAMNQARVSSIYDTIYDKAMHGLGWSLLFERGTNDYALASYNNFLSCANNNFLPMNSYFDVLAGVAISGVLALERTSPTFIISAANSVLTEYPNYQFTHKVSVNYKHVRMSKVQAHYYIGEYTNAASEMDILDPTNAPHSNDPVKLLTAIQNLSGSL